jgi:hypothetical protein
VLTKTVLLVGQSVAGRFDNEPESIPSIGSPSDYWRSVS